MRQTILGTTQRRVEAKLLRLLIWKDVVVLLKMLLLSLLPMMMPMRVMVLLTIHYLVSVGGVVVACDCDDQNDHLELQEPSSVVELLMLMMMRPMQNVRRKMMMQMMRLLQHDSFGTVTNHYWPSKNLQRYCSLQSQSHPSWV